MFLECAAEQLQSVIEAFRTVCVFFVQFDVLSEFDVLVNICLLFCRRSKCYLMGFRDFVILLCFTQIFLFILGGTEISPKALDLNCIPLLPGKPRGLRLYLASGKTMTTFFYTLSTHSCSS